MSISDQEAQAYHMRRVLEELRSIILAGLNAGNGDGEWEALVNAADTLGIEYDDEENDWR